MSIVLASAIAGGLSALGNIYSAHQQRSINRNNIYNQWQMYNATNEYNSPINTINRYKEAGLNPALMYGNVSPGYASNMNMAVQHAPQLDLSGVGDAISNALNYQQRERQIEIAEKNQQLATIRNAIDVAMEQSKLKAQTILNDRESAINGSIGVSGYRNDAKFINPNRPELSFARSMLSGLGDIGSGLYEYGRYYGDVLKNKLFRAIFTTKTPPEVRY